VHISPRLRPALANTPRLPARAVLPVLGTCALTAGLGVGILWGASWLGESKSPAGESPVVAHPPAATIVPTAPGRSVQPAIAEALLASDEAYQLVAPPPIALEPAQVAAIHADLEAPFTIVLMPSVAAAPVRATTPAPALSAARPATSEVAGRMAKIAPSDDGLPARVRAKPTTTADIVARVPTGTSLKVLGPADGAKDWLRVTWNGITGYVRADLVR
jgi:hypothetical protein